ncbi:MAG: hypothetical protein K6E58_00670 [Eubacterium sp.]|nr:hypothetical protein [Eubacterium sp.]
METKKLFCQIGGIKYEIEYKYSYIEKKFKDYIIEKVEKSDDVYQISYTDKDFDRWMNEDLNIKEPAYIEFSCIMEKIASDLPNHDMLLMHGATIEYKGKAYVFTAPSGTGKSTHIKLWKEHLGDNVSIINGDKPEVSFKDGKVYMHGAPWCGKEGWQINTSAPLAGVCLVERGKENKIEQIHPGENIEFFMMQLYLVDEPGYLIKVVDLFKKMAEAVPFYRLECDISEDAAKCSFEAMTGEEW